MLVQTIKRHPWIRVFIDLKLTTVCLFLLFLLTFLGTMHQVENGLYDAQKRYFESWFVLVGGFLPLPGAQLVLWVLFINLLAATIVRFVYSLARIGILIIHLGIYILFVGMFFTHYFAQESFLTLQEGEGRNVVTDYFEWELATWKQGEPSRRIVSADARNLAEGRRIDFTRYGFAVEVEEFHPNARAYLQRPGETVEFVNMSGIGSFEPVSASRKPEENLPAALIRVAFPNSEDHRVFLFGGDINPVTLSYGGNRFAFSLRKMRFEIPFVVHLEDFRAEFYPESDKPKSFESDVRIEAPEIARKVRISMNKPLRTRGYTFYQASYAIGASGDESSTFAVVRNRGRLVPYFATLVIGSGLIVHFVLMLLKPIARRKRLAS